MASRFQISEDVICQRVQDQMVLLDLRDQRFYSLDDVGSEMWTLLAEHGDPEVVIQNICACYDVEEAQARSDLELLLSKLQAAKLIGSVVV